jgi:type VI secretion system protein ImpM
VTTIGTSVPGIFGKLPSYGDFLTRGLPQSFVSPWDLWLQQALACSKASIGSDWLRHYLVGPIWRFVLTDGVAGQDAWAGLLMPSVDKVERCYPLTLACPVAKDVVPFALIEQSADWFNRAETLMLDWLEQDANGATVDLALDRLGSPPEGASELSVSAPVEGSDDAWRLPLPDVGQNFASYYQALLHKSLSDQFYAYSLWWFQGARTLAPSLLLCQGLPPPEGFSAMLDGDWERGHWQNFAGFVTGYPSAGSGSRPHDG